MTSAATYNGSSTTLRAKSDVERQKAAELERAEAELARQEAKDAQDARMRAYWEADQRQAEAEERIEEKRAEARAERERIERRAQKRADGIIEEAKVERLARKIAEDRSYGLSAPVDETRSSDSPPASNLSDEESDQLWSRAMEADGHLIGSPTMITGPPERWS